MPVNRHGSHMLSSCSQGVGHRPPRAPEAALWHAHPCRVPAGFHTPSQRMMVMSWRAAFSTAFPSWIRDMGEGARTGGGQTYDQKRAGCRAHAQRPTGKHGWAAPVFGSVLEPSATPHPLARRRLEHCQTRLYLARWRLRWVCGSLGVNLRLPCPACRSSRPTPPQVLAASTLTPLSTARGLRRQQVR